MLLCYCKQNQKKKEEAYLCFVDKKQKKKDRKKKRIREKKYAALFLRTKPEEERRKKKEEAYLCFSLKLEEDEEEHWFAGVFSGNLSLDVMEGSKWNMTRSGFCGMRSRKFDGFIDLDGYDTIALKLKGDGRCYISTIYTENWVNTPGQDEDNSWQAFVFVPKENWYIAKIPLTRYVPTWRGNMINAKLEMNPARILGMSLSVNAEGGVPGAKSGPGDFQVEVDWIKALRMQ